jgi:hypothetical protein
MPQETTTVPVDPPVHVERYASHVSLSWTAGGVERFLGTVRDVSVDAPAVVDATNTAGRRQVELTDIDTTTGATTYVRAEPERPWTVAWERRSTPVVTLTGTPEAAITRRIHTGTTGCAGWSRSQQARLARLLDAV